ncbi:acyltransferase family protein [Gimibacter soli]|uniref:Acyltransferase n=1 Tax=Gimibacter soli TaxID=3024400 RepID=A0AAF0BG51_9PROT|nr:acyltransferase [Gimibacter soli]WCL53188.1 acyltransferase [Gimibacter soli]
MKTNQGRGTITSLESLRGICAILVLLFHIPWESQIGNLGIVRHASLAVDFFFVLSGFVLSLNYADKLNTPSALVTFMRRRFWRLYPLHLTVLFLFALYEMATFVLQETILGGYGTPAFSDSMTIYGLSLSLSMLTVYGLVDHLPWNQPSWSIAAEMFVYVVFSCFATLMPGRCRLAAFSIVAILTAYWVISTNISPFLSHTYDLGWARALGGFFAGVIGWLTFDKIRDHITLPATVCTAVGLVGFAFIWLVAPNSQLSFAAWIVFPAVIVAMSLSVPGGIFTASPLVYLGRVSFSLYMLHALIIAVIKNVLQLTELHSTFPMSGDVYALTVVALTTFSANIAYRMVEEPFRNGISWLRDRTT